MLTFDDEIVQPAFDDLQIVVVPLRVNVNLKAATMEDLIGCRKVLQLTHN
jgi:hypothetical protein